MRITRTSSRVAKFSTWLFQMTWHSQTIPSKLTGEPFKRLALRSEVTWRTATDARRNNEYDNCHFTFVTFHTVATVCLSAFLSS
jgi:hypothetical protein